MSTVLSDDQAKANIAANVSRLLREKGITQRSLASKTDEPEMTISRIVRGTNMPGSGLLARIAEALSASVDELLATPKRNSRRSA
jgi:transcriptional regulator with XRE-family HTH domain